MATTVANEKKHCTTIEESLTLSLHPTILLYFSETEKKKGDPRDLSQIISRR
jgi:hypothetical protein